jgi:Tol biopolymer transport system component
MGSFREAKNFIILSLVEIVLASCTAPKSITPIPPTQPAPENTPTFTLELPTLTPTVDQLASDNQMLAYLYVPGEDPGPSERLAELYTVRADGSQRTRLFSEKEMMIRDLVSSPDGKQISFWGCPGDMLTDCYSEGDSDILVIDWVGGAITRLTGSPGHDRYPDWSPDGRIAFVSDRAGSEQIYTMNPDGSDQRKLTDQPRYSTHPRWSPEGKWIAYENFQAGRHSIFVISPEGELAGEPISGASPDWSPVSLPGGLRLAFDCFQSDGSLDICTARPDGSGQVNLTNTSFDEHCPAWSPDGNWLAFHVNNGRETYISKVCTTCPGEVEAIRLTAESTPAGCLMWSPDGWQIAYLNVHDQGLWLMNADGSDSTRLAEGPLFSPIWRP